MTAFTRDRRRKLMRTLVVSSLDVTPAQRDAARDELRAMEIRRMDALRRRRARIHRDLAAAQSAVAQQPPGMTSVANYLVAAVAALADYIDEHHASLEADSQDHLESLEALRPAGEAPPLRALDRKESRGLGATRGTHSTGTRAEQKGAAKRTAWMEPEYLLRWPELALVLDLAAGRIDHQAFVHELERFDWPNDEAVELADLLCLMLSERSAAATEKAKEGRGGLG